MPASSSTSTTKVKDAIGAVLDGPAARLLGAYYEPSPMDYAGIRAVMFAGRFFDELPPNPVDEFTVGDLAAVSLLDVRFGPHTITQLIYEDDCNTLLAEIPGDVPLWDIADDQISRGAPAWRLWDHLNSIPGIGPTRASKLLSRKRPHLMPILDSVIVNALSLGRTNQWQRLKHALDVETRDRINMLATAATKHGAVKPSTLRLLDVATWMTNSQSRNARAVRRHLCGE